MKRETIQNPVCGNGSLKVLRRVEKVERRGSGAPVKRSYWQVSTRKPEAVTGIRFPVYDSKQDGNVFNWILQASEDFRQIKQRQKYVEFEKAAAKSEGMDKARVEN